MDFSFYNEITKKQEKLKKPNKIINIYLCGPTVYDDVHIGNLRPVFIVDVIIRIFNYLGYKVNYVQNITDINEKIINVAQKTKKSETYIATKFTKRYLEILKKINIVYPNKIPLVTNYIKEIKNFSNKILKTKNAYKINSGIYFNIANDLKYGYLSKRKPELKINCEKNKSKKHIEDFSVWKTINIKNHIFNERPSWHTECAALIDIFFGQKLDIHVGGNDLIFPHHENEACLYRSLYNKEITNRWIHIGQIQKNNKKMSKSLGNVIYANKFLSNNNSNILKYCIFARKYRAPLNINKNLIHEANKKTKQWEKIINNGKKMNKIIEPSGVQWDNFLFHLLNDLNIPLCFSIINNLGKKINILYRKNIDSDKLNIYYNNFKNMLSLLGFSY